MLPAWLTWFVPSFVWRFGHYVLFQVLVPLLMPLVENNLVPDFITRFGIRLFLRWRLQLSEQGTVEGDMVSKMTYVKDLKQRPIAVAQDLANEQHYEVPARFYDLCLGPWKKYSCGMWPEGCTSLDESEVHGLRLMAERAQLERLRAEYLATSRGRTGVPRPKVLDLGCGWGSVTLFVATSFPEFDVMGVSNSASQREYILGQAQKRGLTNVRVQTADAAQFDTEERFDRVISIEMFEHMKNYQLLLRKVARWLKPHGKLFVHIFTHVKYAYHFEDGWMADNFFSGGQMPSDDLLLYFQDDLSVVDHWTINGKHYKKTCDAWLDKLDAHKHEALELFRDRPSPIKELVNWRLFFLVCGESFAYGDGREWIVSHYLFEKPAAEGESFSAAASSSSSSSSSSSAASTTSSTTSSVSAPASAAAASSRKRE